MKFMRSTAMLLAVLMIFGLTGCGKKTTPYTPPVSVPSNSSSTSLPLQDSRPDSDTSASSVAPSQNEPEWPKDDFSALPQEVQQLFLTAQTLYGYFYLAPPATEGESASINGMEVFHVSPAAFADYSAFYTAVLSCFTADYAESALFGNEEYFSLDGELYTSLASRASNSTFRYAKAELTSQTDTQIDFAVTAHYYEAYQPENLRESTKTVNYTAVYTENGWRFSLFGGYL